MDAICGDQNLADELDIPARVKIAARLRKAGRQDFDSATFVSETEADLFRRLAPEVAAKVTYFNNGVDADYFSPQNIYA